MNLSVDFTEIHRNQRGFSLIELLVVLVIMAILATFSLVYFNSHKRLLAPEEQALKIVDLLREGRQRSLTQRETFRIEIDLTDNVVRLINERDQKTTPAKAVTIADDVKIKELVLLPTGNVKVGTRPPDISTDPNPQMPMPIAQFKPSVYLNSLGHNVCTIRFKSTDDRGAVFNAGTNEIGAGDSLTGSTLFIWSPKEGDANKSEIALAVTVIATNGSIGVWQYDKKNNKWNLN